MPIFCQHVVSAYSRQCNFAGLGQTINQPGYQGYSQMASNQGPAGMMDSPQQNMMTGLN